MRGTDGKLGTRRLQQLSESFLKSLTYHFSPLAQLAPDYNAGADYRRRMEMYAPDCLTAALPFSFSFSNAYYENDDMIVAIPSYLTSFFASKDGMGERTDFRMVRLSSPYIMQPLLLVSCYYKERNELYLYTMDKAKNLVHQYALFSMPRTGDQRYGCLIEATAVNALTVTITPPEGVDEQMRVVTLKIGSDGHFSGL